MNPNNAPWSWLHGYICAATMLLVISCGPSKKVRKTDTTPSPPNQAVLSTPSDFYKLSFKHYNQFQGDAKVDIRSASLNQNAEVRFKTEHKQMTSTSVRAGAFGVMPEVVFSVMKPDSVLVLDRFSTQYFLLDWSMSQKFLKIPLTLDMYQNLITGNPPLYAAHVDKHSYLNGQLHIQQTIDNFTQDLVIDTASRQLQSINLKHNSQNYSMRILYSDYRLVQTGDNGPSLMVPHAQDWALNDGNEVWDVRIKYTKMMFNSPVEIIYNIPLRYRKGQL